MSAQTKLIIVLILTVLVLVTAYQALHSKEPADFSLPTYEELYGPPDTTITRYMPDGEPSTCRVWDRRRVMASHAAHVECSGFHWFPNHEPEIQFVTPVAEPIEYTM